MSKFSAPHTSYLDNAEPIIKYLKRIPEISKISLGIIKPKKSASRSVTKPKIILQNNHILIKINTKLYNQEIRVYGKGLEEIRRFIVHALEKLKIPYTSSK